MSKVGPYVAKTIFCEATVNLLNNVFLLFLLFSIQNSSNAKWKLSIDLYLSQRLLKVFSVEIKHPVITAIWKA